MTASAMSRGFNGWRFVVERAARHRRLVYRCTMRMAHGSLMTAFEAWLAWAERDSVRARLLRTEDQLAGTQVELTAAQERITREVKRGAVSIMRISSLEHQLESAEVAGNGAIISLQRLRSELRDTCSELALERERLASARAECEDALAFGRSEQTRRQSLETQLADARKEIAELQSELAQERAEGARSSAAAERERLRLAQVALDAEEAAARDRAACAVHEAEVSSLKDSLATLSRSHHYYSRQLALLSRQHAQWVSSVSLPSIQHQVAGMPPVGTEASSSSLSSEELL